MIIAVAIRELCLRFGLTLAISVVWTELVQNGTIWCCSLTVAGIVSRELSDWKFAELCSSLTFASLFVVFFCVCVHPIADCHIVIFLRRPWSLLPELCQKCEGLCTIYLQAWCMCIVSRNSQLCCNMMKFENLMIYFLCVMPFWYSEKFELNSA